jgi:putative membrane-bound dehydrogenase-like protein
MRFVDYFTKANIMRFFEDLLSNASTAKRITYALMIAVCLSPSLSAQKPIYDTQQSDGKRLDAVQAAQAMKLPKGFSADVVAAEPDVQQPIASAWDSRGRLWIAENYTYSENPRNFDTDLKDRILVLEDTDRNGSFEKRTVFWDRASKLTSVEIGFGGIWALAPPNLFFIPDQNGDDVPDSEPQIILDGFDADRVRHNFANGLRWGPDGWLYGRHGIQATSFVGQPGQPVSERTELNCCIWRVHPQSKRFEIVCQGTTNSWGMDWDGNGHLFFINTVIGHLWHALPGAHYQRMYGQDLDPNVYQLLPQAADHVHWNVENEEWHRIQKTGISKETDQAGGGHAHSGMLIYQGDNWPADLRGSLLTLNLHGRRINRDRLDRKGAGFVGRHQPDWAQSEDPWFRGIDLSTGPDGAVYVLDWSDTGECHDNDGIHRQSGRVYRIRHGEIKNEPLTDLRTMDDASLVWLLSLSNNWFARQARLILTERAVAGTLSKTASQSLTAGMRTSSKAHNQLEHLWTAYACGLTKLSDLQSALDDPNEHVRIWAIKLLTDKPLTDDKTVEIMRQRVSEEKSDLVKLYLASSLNRIGGAGWWDLATAMATQGHLESDRDYGLALWYAIKENVATHPEQAVRLVQSKPIAPLTEFISRRLTSQIDSVPVGVDSLVAILNQNETRGAILKGMTTAVRGRRKLEPPAGWTKAVSDMAKDNSPETKQAIATLGAVFGQGLAIEQLKAMVDDGKLDTISRRDALRSLLDAKAEGLVELAWKFINDRDLSSDAIRCLAVAGQQEDAERLIESFANLSAQSKVASIQTLAGRRDFVPILLAAVEDKRIPPDAVDASMLRQIQMSSDGDVIKRMTNLWPQIKLLNESKLQRIQALEKMLSQPDHPDPNLANGRRLWNQHCAGCHRLFGEGASIGPEITGAQRSNVRYVLENVVDPSASVADNFRVSLFLLTNGQVVTGVPISKSPESIVVQTSKEQVVILTEDIDEVKTSQLSLMPDGLLDGLSESDQRDLIGYVQSPVQVALP